MLKTLLFKSTETLRNGFLVQLLVILEFGSKNLNYNKAKLHCKQYRSPLPVGDINKMKDHEIASMGNMKDI